MRNAHFVERLTAPGHWALRALAAVVSASAMAASAQTLPPPAAQPPIAQPSAAGPNRTVGQDNKQQLLGFLTRLKQAIDADVVGKPERLRQVLGLEVLEWNPVEYWPPKFAQRWRYNVPAMDAEPLLLRSPDVGYGIGSLDPALAYGYGLRINNLERVACISPAAVDAVFGRAPIQFATVPAPLHGATPPLNQPLWWASAYHYKADTRLLLSLAYRTTNARPPEATCLSGLVAGVGKARGLPLGYPQ